MLTAMVQGMTHIDTDKVIRMLRIRLDSAEAIAADEPTTANGAYLRGKAAGIKLALSLLETDGKSLRF